jgi:hypothetical protein
VNDDGSQDRSELDDELRRLFADARLTVPVASGAEQAVVRGAHRRRRQRLAVAAAGGVIAVIAVVTVSLGLSGVIKTPGRLVQAARPPQDVTLTTTSTTSTPPPDDWSVLGPRGIGPLYLGMSLKDLGHVVKITGTQTMSPTSGCQAVTAFAYFAVDPSASQAIPESPPAPGVSVPTVVVTTAGTDRTARDQTTDPVPTQQAAADALAAQSAASGRRVLPLTVDVVGTWTAGVVRLGGTGVHTPQGIGVGSSMSDLYRVYPAMQRMVPETGFAETPVPGNPTALYVFDIDKTGHVQAISLRSKLDKC